MSKPHVRAADREREAARALGGKRVVHRPRFQSAPDIEPVSVGGAVLPPAVLQPEVATRARLPALIRTKIAQARRYSPDAIPVAVLSGEGEEAVVVLPLRAFAQLCGLQESRLSAQLPLPFVERGP